MEFVGFPKIPRFSRECIVTEKIDGTNACIYIGIDEDGTPEFLTGSRTRWITPDKDNHGFSRWAHEHRNELEQGLGPGLHFGEYWGQGIQRNYGIKEKRFSLFNVTRWGDDAARPKCCHVVPVLWRGPFDDTTMIVRCLGDLEENGSEAVPGFMKPEGIVIYHVAGNCMFKKTIEGDDEPKGVPK